MVLALQAEAGSHSAVVAPKRLGSAVRRNRLKRWMREALRREPWMQLHASLVWTVVQYRENIDFACIRGEMHELLGKVKECLSGSLPSGSSIPEAPG